MNPDTDVLSPGSHFDIQQPSNKIPGMLKDDPSYQKMLRQKSTDAYYSDSLNILPKALVVPMDGAFPFSRDTIASAAKKGDNGEVAVATLQQAQITPESIAGGDGDDLLSTHPKLSAPKKGLSGRSAQLANELLAAIKRNQDVNLDRQEAGAGEGGDKLFYAALMDVVKELMRLKEHQALTSKDIVEQKMLESKELQKKFGTLAKQIASGEDQSEVAAKIKLASDIILGISGAIALLCFIGSFFTFGLTAAIGAAVQTGASVLGGIAGVMSGSTKIYGAVIDDKTNRHRAELHEVKHDRTVNNEQVTAAIKEDEAGNNEMIRILRMANSVAQSRRKANSAILGG